MSASAQISPGELADVHANLEGISNCTKCHTLGSKVSNDKCLQCHTDLNARLKLQKGYHASVPVKGKPCVSCHSDHHGRKFQIIRFKLETFDHLFTGYKLQGAHAKKECRDCHKPAFITSPEIRKRKFTYQGLNTNCASCHTDYHQNTLSLTCSNCHGFEAFKPASKFNHSLANFQLAGKHTDVECIKCHRISTKNGLKFQEFKGIPFEKCINCHNDPHNNQFGKNCSDCHSVESFQALKSSSKFDHSKTNFKLEDKHQQVTCKSCHKGKISDPLKHAKCMDCHKDYHQKQFVVQGDVQDCSACHDTKGFNTTSFSIDRHNDGAYKLEGLHLNVACLKCHKKQDQWKFRNLGKRCKDCHIDYHENQFVKQGEVQDCSDCHETKGFNSSSFTLEQHNEGAFRLTGSHIATPCFACHKKQDKWKFRDIGKACRDCHENIHQNFIPEKYYPGESCGSCHNLNRWSGINFDHKQTQFELEGAHSSIACRSCHFNKERTGHANQQFTGLAHNCSNCHADKHAQQFEINGITDCSRCHTAESYKPATKFDHSKTQFVLDGKHIHVACNKCHKEVANNGVTFVLYKIKEFKCENCHH
jgi:hypothetical protein